MYLPQYHVIPENSKFWGEGYTDWVAVKKSKPLFKGHDQPRIPLNNNYYDLSKKDAVAWQCKLAKENGIDGFGIYHYWFNSNLHLLDTPPKIIEENKDIDIDYFFCWDNASWRRTWSNVKVGNDWAPLFESGTEKPQNNGILAELIYGNKEDWKNHFEYLLPYFQDQRYIKVDGKPVFGLFNQDNGTEILRAMSQYWEELAKQYGFPGMYIIGRKKNNNIKIVDHEFIYEPEWDGWTWKNSIERIKNKVYKESVHTLKHLYLYDYDRIWKNVLRTALKHEDDGTIMSGFVSYDDSPRRGKNGKIVLNDSPEKFYSYFKQLLESSIRGKKEMVFLVAWNEWGEGAYLEPDTTNGYDYLLQIRKIREELEK